MTDTATEVSARNKWNLARAMLIGGYVMCFLIALMLVTTAVVYMLMYPDQKVPDVLNQWVGVTIGFIFGTMGSMIKDFVGSND